MRESLKNTAAQMGREPWCPKRLKWMRPTRSDHQYMTPRLEAARHDPTHMSYGTSENHRKLGSKGH
jgi:hypothetical protein